MPTKVALFTPYSPAMGGGGQNLRGAIPNLQDVDITWHYLSEKPADAQKLADQGITQINYLGQPVLGGALLRSVGRFYSLTKKHKPPHKLIAPIVEKLLEADADCYWIIAHYEGFAVAEALIAAGKRVHVSVHDVPGALCGRSRRYFWATGLLNNQLGRLLKSCASVDYTSHPMRKMCEKLFGVTGVCYFPYVKELPPYIKAPSSGPFRVAYAGSLYSPKEPKLFAQALKILEGRLGRSVELHLWGLNALQSSWVEDLAVPAIVHPFCVEADLLESLKSVNMLYVMYPFDRSSRIFRQTSHPAKLSTYLKAQRPVFAHTQNPASLVDYLMDTAIGAVSDSQDPKEIAKAMQRLILSDVPPSAYADARTRWYGEDNLAGLNNALINK